MTDRIDQEGRASFVQTLPRKVTELRATLGTLVADPRSQRMRDELRRRLHALYTLTRSYNLPTLSEGLREGIAHLDAVRGAHILTQRDLETLADLIATLPALASRDLPEQPQLFQRPAASAAAAAAREVVAPPSAGRPRSSVAPKAGEARASIPAIPSKRSTAVGMPAVPASVETAVAAPDVTARGAATQVPLGMLVVGGAGIGRDVKRVLPPDAEITTVRTLSEAVTAARDTAPDVIVAECAPPADGLGLIAALRGDPLTDFLPVVLIATATDGIDPETARAQGATDLLVLPVEPTALREAIDRAAQGVVQNSLPPPAFGELTLEQLTQTLQEEIRRGILGAAGPRAGGARIALGQGSEVLAATWEAIARVRDVVERRTHGKVRFEMPGSPLGITGAHVLSIGADEPMGGDDDGATDDPLPGRAALVVDDDPGVVWFFAGLLRESGMAVTECTEGVQALKEARRIRPDLVISDILMPGMDGFALCRAIRRDVSLRHTPVILLSWKEDLLVRMRELGAQAQGFLRKEARGEAILARVRAVLRPRVRLLRRLEILAEGAELRGRVERVGMFALLENAGRALADATLTITDSFSVTELDLREGRLVAVVRTLQDGSLSRGESALLQVLGASNARFTVRRAKHPVRANVHGELDALLAGGAALISALEDSLSGAALLEVATIDLDAEAATAYARSLPEGMRTLVGRVVAGESPRNLVLRDGRDPQELEPLLVELARRGAIRSVRGAQGEDLVGPRYTAGQYGDSLRPGDELGLAAKDSGTMPAVLKIPEAPRMPSGLTVPETSESGRSDDVGALHESESEPDPEVIALTQRIVAESQPASRPADEAPSPASATPSKPPGWTPPKSVDEAAKPGFGLEAEHNSLADAVLRELSDPPASGGADDGPEIDASAPDDADGEDAPEIEETTGEAHLTDDELSRAAEKSGLPLEGVRLDARGLPRRRTSVPDLPEISGAPFEPHERATKKVDLSPSGSIIVDEAAVGGPVHVVERPRRSARQGSDTAPPPPRGAERSEGGRVVALIGAVVVLAAAGYFGMQYALARRGTDVPFVMSETHEAGASFDATPTSATADAAGASTETVDDGGARVDANGDGADASQAATIAVDAAAPAQGGSATALYEAPGPYLDGGVLTEGHGLLVVESPARDAEIVVDQRPVGHGPLTLQLAPGVHTVRYRNHAVVVFRFVPIQAGRASRIMLSTEP